MFGAPRVASANVPDVTSSVGTSPYPCLVDVIHHAATSLCLNGNINRSVPMHFHVLCSPQAYVFRTPVTNVFYIEQSEIVFD